MPPGAKKKGKVKKKAKGAVKTPFKGAKTKKSPGKLTARKKVTLPSAPSMNITAPSDMMLLFYGPPGVGKTTFANNMGRVFFLSTDRGTRFLEAMREPLHSFDDAQAIITALEAHNDLASVYDILCIDHIDDFCAFYETEAARQLGIQHVSDADYGKGWSTFRKLLQRDIQRLVKLGLGLVFICHEQMETFKVGVIEKTRTVPQLSGTARRVFLPFLDMVGYCGYRRVKKGGKPVEIRTIETMPREDLWAKDRSHRSKPAAGFAELDGKKFIATFSK